jgi:hypothetical protein
MNIRKGRAALAGLGACCVLGGVTLGTQAAQAQSSLPLTPTLDCVVSTATGLTAYFGYMNTGPDSITIDIGDNNGIAPGEVDAGQPPPSCFRPRSPVSSRRRPTTTGWTPRPAG